MKHNINERPDILFYDLHSGDERGIQLAHRLRNIAHHTGRTIVCSLGERGEMIAKPGETPILK